MAYGVAGLSVVVDSLSAIKYAKVKPIRDENGISIDFIIEGDYPKFGNDDDKNETNEIKSLHENLFKLSTDCISSLINFSIITHLCTNNCFFKFIKHFKQIILTL